MTSKWKLVDLFAGTGAFTLAFQETGLVETVYANDMVEPSKKIYDENFRQGESGHALDLRNLHDVPVEEIPAHDILTGGFPCQPFSIAGKQAGFEDERANVFWKILAILAFHRPRFIILENVKNLVSHDEKRTFHVIVSELEKLGYHLQYKVLDTSKITGVPQHRERIYIVGYMNPEEIKYGLLEFDPVPKNSISSLLDPVDAIADKYYYKEGCTCWNLLEPAVTKINTVYQYRRVYVRENKSDECPTLTANMGSGGHNVPIVKDDRGIRKLTPRECFRFQGFPDTYKFPKGMSDTALYKLAGNAVSVPVVRLIANRIVKYM